MNSGRQWLTSGADAITREPALMPGCMHDPADSEGPTACISGPISLGHPVQGYRKGLVITELTLIANAAVYLSPTSLP